MLRYFFGGAAETKAEAAKLGGAPRGEAAPPARAVPASELGGRQLDTAEVAPPPSVAERTTNLLGKK
jgi:hypothetical protein